MNKVHLFTSAACNYIPKVRLLFQSVKKFHPDWEIHLALPDQISDAVDTQHEPFDHIWSIERLDIPYWRPWAFCHEIVELATAIKPFALLKIMETFDVEKIIYLDPDIVVFSPLDDILEALEECSMLLTPHLTEPEEHIEAVMDNEICSLRHGIYNLGFLGIKVDPESRRFARWWAKRLYHFCRAETRHGLFTDQRWIDLVPAFFSGVGIVRSPRHNVASWNLTHRKITGNFESGFFVNGEPLGFYHFTGFDSGAHNVMALKNIGINESVQKLLTWYKKTTEELGKDPLAQIPWAFGTFSDGTPILKAQRIVYRERPDLQKAFPDPFDATGYLAWWQTQGVREYPRLASGSIEDSTLVETFPYLSPGFLAGKRVDSFQGLKLIKDSLRHPETIPYLMKRGWYILKNEGLAGLTKRLG